MVLSATLERVEWKNSTLLNGSIAQELTKFRSQPGQNIQIPETPRD